LPVFEALVEASRILFNTLVFMGLFLNFRIDL